MVAAEARVLPPRRWTEPPVLLALAAILLGALRLGLLLGASPTPADTSAEAGFARDMAVHHAQAVELAGIARGRTEDAAVRLLATDIELTQQGQIGQMFGWLAAWGLRPTGTEPTMAWMGMPTAGRMPGMATPAQVAALQQLAPREMDAEFLRLMIVHHRAGVGMAEAVLPRTERPEVLTLARSIVASQQSEIDAMQDMLRRWGAAAPPETAGAHHSASTHAITDEQSSRGYAGVLARTARAAVGLAPILLGVLAAAWLALDTLRRRTPAGRSDTASRP